MATQRKGRATLEQFLESGGDLCSCIREETLLIHTTTAFGANGDTLEGRVLAKIVLPSGEEFVAEKVIKLRFKRERVTR